MDWVKNKFGLSKTPAAPIVSKQPITNQTTLYVKKVGDGDYMVSHLALGGYDKYTDAGGKGCWTSDGVPSGIAGDTANPPVKIPEMVEDTLIANTKCKDKPEVYQQSGDSDMKVAIMNHVRIRFAQLECILEKNDNVKVIIGGGTVDNTYKFKDGGDTKPTLGRDLAVKQWKEHIETKNDKEGGKDVADAIEDYCNRLMGTFNKRDNPKRIFIGVVGFDHQLNSAFKKSRDKEKTDFGIDNLDPSEKLIHVWGANIKNFDKSNDDSGSGQAAAVRHRKAKDNTSNAAGAFGIITTPLNATAENIALSNEKLLKLFTPAIGGSKPRNRTRSKKRRNSRKSK